MSLRLTIEIAGQPRPKGRHQTRVVEPKDGGKPFSREYPDPKTVKYESQIRWAAQQEMGGQAPTKQPVRVAVIVTLVPAAKWEWAASCGSVRPHLRGSGDADNYLKVVGDALNKLVWFDDSQIVEATVSKIYGERASLLIEIEEIELPAVPSRRASRAKTAPASDLFAGMPT